MKKMIAWLSKEDIVEFSESYKVKTVHQTSTYSDYENLLDSRKSISGFLEKTMLEEVCLLTPVAIPFKNEFNEWIGPRVKIINLDLKNTDNSDKIFDIILKKEHSINKATEGELLVLLPSKDFPPREALKKIIEFLDASAFEYTDEMKIEHLPSSPRYIPKFQKPAGFEEFIGVSKKMATLLNKADIATRFPTAVLITGESGTGRKLLAQAIAQKSVSDGFPVKIVTFTDKTSFMEPVLLGDGIRPGKLKEADNGVIILDNINKCSLYTQMTLLNIMRDTQSNCYTSRPTAPNQPEISSKFRIIATSSENLLELVREGQFSEELYYLLADITIQTPPLKGRGDDILLLAHYFLQCANKELQTDSSPRINKSLSTNAQKALKKYSWPGNLRELKHKIRQAWIFAEGNEIESVDLFPNSRHKTLPEKIPSGFNLKKKIDDQQKEYIKLAMKQTGEKKTEAAKLLGLKSYQALDVKIRSLKISPWYQEEDNADSKQTKKISTNKKESKDQQSKSQ